MKVGSLFSGIEGFGLGLRMAGLNPEIVWVAEREPFPLQILARHHPDARVYTDVADVTADAERVDWLVGGFPCQPASQAGKGLGTADERWLWPHFARIIDALRPDVVIAENVRGLLREGRGMSDVLADLARIGYSCQWDLIPAFASGAPHLRHRVWIVAYPTGASLGPVFAHPPWRFPWPNDPATLEGEARIPRLIRAIPQRKERLTALGNAVVPQAVASVSINVQMARTLEPLTPPRLIPDVWPERFPNAGALIDGHVFAMPTSAPRMPKRPIWPTPKALPSGPDYARLNRDGSGGDDLATAVAREESGRTREAETLWQTPTAAPWSHGGGGGELVSQIKTEQGEEIGGWSRDGEAPDDPGRSLNPRWVEWLMGYPQGWTDPETSTTVATSASETKGDRA